MQKKSTKIKDSKNDNQIIEEEKDPMLRALQKKVRNMNKKLSQIKQLQLRKDLKREQQQKLAKKSQVSEQREKYFQMIEIYKQIAAESEKVIRKLQLTELEDLAGIIAIKEFGVDLGTSNNQHVDNLVKVLTAPTSHDLSLQQRTQEISNVLMLTANNNKLKKAIKQYIEYNSAVKAPKSTSQAMSNKPEPISPQSEKQREKELNEFVEQQKFQLEKVCEVSEPLTPQIVQQSLSHTSPQKSENVLNPQSLSTVPQIQQPKNNDQKKVDEGNQLVIPETDTKINATVTPTQVNQENERTKSERKINEDKQKRRQSGGSSKGKPTTTKYKKALYKPKNQQQHSDNKESSSSYSQNDAQPQPRQFRKQQIKQLIQDGFIVVGKAKPKPKDQKSYQQFSFREHGKKNYRRQTTKKNY